MIDNLGLGPPAQGFPGPQMREASRDPREDASGSFKRTLGEKSDPKISDVPREKLAERKSKDPDERPTEVKREKSAEPGPKRAKGTRDQAIREFMDSFESEFRIPPTKIVEAMAKIEPEKLEATPEATAKDVIEQLDLAPEDEAKAMAMYAGLLSQLQNIDRAAKPMGMVPTDSAMMAPQIRERMMVSKDRREAMTSAVENLNQKFWMTNVHGNSAMNAQASQAGMKALEAGKMQVDPSANFSEMGEDGMMMLDADSLENLPADNMENATPVMAGAKPMSVEGKAQANANAQGLRGARKATPEEMKRVLENLRNAAESLQSDQTSAQIEQLASQGDREGASSVGLMGMAKVGDKAEVAQAPLDTSAAAKSFMVQNSPKEKNGNFGQQGHGNGGGGAKGESSSSGGGGEMKAFSLASAAAAPVPLKMEDVAAALKNVAPAGTPSIVANTQEHETNVRQIMNQAQYLIKKGGGEVKVEMSPEGLGNLQMKVMVKDGKVNVQMAAETNEAKKAIESSLPELRSSLAAHKLSMDHVKVDVVSGPSTDTQTRNDTNNPNPQQHRETRQFWNQFQENFGNRGAREGLWDLPDMKGYRTAKAPAALEPIGDNKSSASAKRADGRGSGLNLVA